MFPRAARFRVSAVRFHVSAAQFHGLAVRFRVSAVPPVRRWRTGGAWFASAMDTLFDYHITFWPFVNGFLKKAPFFPVSAGVHQ